MNTTKYTTRLVSKHHLADHLLELVFEKPSGFIFEAGQFVQFIIPNGDTTLLRSYSLASRSDDTKLLFFLKLIPGGKASYFFHKMEPHTPIEFKGPVGRFVINPKEASYCFIATGTGLAPIFAMIEDELRTKKISKQIELIFGVRNETNIFWLDKLDELKNQFKNFSYILTLSRPSAKWHNTRGRVTDHIPDEVADKGFYLCGSGEMVKDVRTTLLNTGVDPTKIHFEIF